MATILIESEKQLIDEIRHSDLYNDFLNVYLKHKIEREQKAWQLLQANRGQYTKELLNSVFDIVDLEGSKTRWFGSLLAMPNKNLIFASPIEQITEWIEILCFSREPVEHILDKCLGNLKIKGASKGLATLLLYLSDPERYKIWVNATYEGLSTLGRLKETKNSKWGARYVEFNDNANEFAKEYGIKARELDWFLSFMGRYVASDGQHYEIDQDVLSSKNVPVSVDDEDEIDDMVGELMELGLMRWSPTNEMGVVALFIEYRTQLGFPIVEFIRPQFPDAAVFEQRGKGYTRKYIEFEYKSRGYKVHLASKRKCHYVVCWEHDWKECPIPVIELKAEIPKILGKKGGST
jgi:hypothetical protein